MATALNPNLLNAFAEDGFATKPFPQELRAEMLRHIEMHIRKIASGSNTDPLQKIAMTIPDDVWSKKMHRAFRMFPKELTTKIHEWADRSIRTEFGKTRSEINRVSAYEASINPSLSRESLVIYWRCVRPGKPDAGRPHRDATFWVLELEEGYDPKIPFPFDYVKDCIKIWIPLQGCSPKTTLQVVPRSHKMDIPIEVDQTEYGRRPTIANSWLKDHEKDFMSPPALSQGSCIIFDMDLVHRGPTHQETELRISAELSLIIQ
jgi:Phytanoyl-CoA dioxygenase (PhyH)